VIEASGEGWFNLTPHDSNEPGAFCFGFETEDII
jgi:hypothetical protein